MRILRTDAIAHGSARRINDGFRRICVMRYMPSWANFRMPYRPTPALLDRLTAATTLWPPGAGGSEGNLTGFVGGLVTL